MATFLDLPLSSDPVLTGSCMCGSVTYTSTTLPSSMGNCHCIACRKLSGAPFITFAHFPSSSITFSSRPASKADTIHTSSSSGPAPGSSALKKVKHTSLAERGHCIECGSPMYMQYSFEPEKIYTTAGTIDESSVKGELPKPSSHIFVAEDEKARWYDIEDRLPRTERFSQAFQKKIDNWKEKNTP